MAIKDERIFTLLNRLICKKENSKLGDIIYRRCDFLFYDAYKEDECTRDKYEDEMKELRHLGLIDIDFKGWNEIEHAVVRATAEGTDWLVAHEAYIKPTMRGCRVRRSAAPVLSDSV